MDTMTGGRTTLTRADRDALPDDGCRHELLDGVLLLTPAPGNRHQHAVGELFFALRSVCPPDLRVRMAPFDVTLAVDTVVQPDILVTRRDDLVERGLDGVPPLLVVEVLSASTRRVDEHLKRARYEAAGVASYWLVDVEDAAAPALTVLTHHDGRYVEDAHVVGNEAYAASAPFPLRVSPADLTD